MWMHVCKHVCVSILSCKSWQTSDGQAAQALNQHNINVQQHRRRGCFVSKPAEQKSDTYPAVSASHWRCPQTPDQSDLGRPCRLPAAVWQRVSLMLRSEDPSQLSWVGHPPAPPSLCSSLSCSSFTAEPGPIESQVSCRDKQVYCPIKVLLPFIACKREVSVFRWSHTYFQLLFYYNFCSLWSADMPVFLSLVVLFLFLFISTCLFFIMTKPSKLFPNLHLRIWKAFIMS